MAGTRPAYSLKIETETVKCLDTGGVVAPDSSAFQSITCCNVGGKGESDFLLFVVTTSSASAGDGPASGVDMVWLDSTSPSGYNKRSLTQADARFAKHKAVHVQAAEGHDGKPILVATFAPTGQHPDAKPDGHQRFVVWTCDHLAGSMGGDDAEKPNWMPCGWVEASHVKRSSVTTSSAGERIVLVEVVDKDGHEKTCHGTSAGDSTTPLAALAKPDGVDAIGQASLAHDSGVEADADVPAISLTLPSPPTEAGALSVRSIPDPSVYQGTIAIEKDARCFATSEGSPKGVDLYVAGTTKAWWYGLQGWSGNAAPTKHLINEVDFDSPAKEIRALVDEAGTKHVWILLEDGDLMYTFDALDDDKDFLEPVSILPSTGDFGCHMDADGNIHVFNINDDGNLVHNVKDEESSLWMQKEILVPGGAPKEQLMSVVEVTVKALPQKNTIAELVHCQALPPLSISCASAAMFRVNGKGHLMYSDKVIEVMPNVLGVVRIIQFVDNFTVPRVMIDMPGLERTIQVLAGKALENKLGLLDGDSLRNAKLADPMGDEGASLITDPDVAPYADDVMASMKGLLSVLGEFEPSELIKPNEVSGSVRLGGSALSEKNKLVAWADDQDDDDEDSDVDEDDQDEAGAGNAGKDIEDNDATAGAGEVADTQSPARSGVLERSMAAAEAPESSKPSARRSAQRFGRRRPLAALLKKRRAAKRASMAKGTKLARRVAAAKAVKKDGTETKSTLVHLSLKERTKSQSAVRPNGSTASLTPVKKILVKHSDAGDIAKLAKEAEEQADLVSKKQAAAELLVASESAQAASARAEADAEEAATAAAEALQYAAEAIEQDTMGYTSRGLLGGPKKRLKNATKKAKKAAQRAKREAEAAAKNAAKAAREATKAAEKATKDAADAANKATKDAAKAAKKAAAEARKAAEAVKDFGGDVVDDVGDGVTAATNNVGDGVKAAANKVGNGIENAVNTIGDGIGTAVDTAGGGIDNAIDKVGGAVKKGANVVESVTMELVEIVEETVELVLEEGPDGVIRRVAKIVKTVAKKAIKVIVEIGGHVLDFIADTIEKAAAALNWVWNKIKVGIKKALEWLASFFSIREIMRTADILQDGIVLALDDMIHSMPTGQDVEKLMKNVRSKLEEGTGLDLDSGELPGQSDGDEEVASDTKSSYVSYHASSGSFADMKGDAEPGSVEEVSSDDNQSEADSGVLSELQDALNRFLKSGSVNDMLSVVVDVLLDIVESVAKGVVETAASGIQAFRDFINGGGKLYIPLVSEMYKLATGRDLKIGKAVFFLLAIPITYTIRAVTGEWPSQMVNIGALRKSMDIPNSASNGSAGGIGSKSPCVPKVLKSTTAKRAVALTRALPTDEDVPVVEGDATNKDTLDETDDGAEGDISLEKSEDPVLEDPFVEDVDEEDDSKAFRMSALVFRTASLLCDTVAICLAASNFGTDEPGREADEEHPRAFFLKVHQVVVLVTQVCRFAGEGFNTFSVRNNGDDEVGEQALIACRLVAISAVGIYQVYLLNNDVTRPEGAINFADIGMKAISAMVNLFLGVARLRRDTLSDAVEDEAFNELRDGLQAAQLSFAGVSGLCLEIIKVAKVKSPMVMGVLTGLKFASNIAGLFIAIGLRTRTDNVFGIGI